MLTADRSSAFLTLMVGSPPNSRMGVKTSSLTITGEVERVTFENEESSFRVLQVSKVEGDLEFAKPLCVVGIFQAVGPGTRVRITGSLAKDPRYGEQLKAETLLPLAPDTLAGLERYLGSGIIKGIGPQLAKRIVASFGLNTLEVLDGQPERLREVSGLGVKKARKVRDSWQAQRAISTVMVLLQTHGASPALATRIWQRYGERSAAIVQGSPYRLALEVRGVGFKTADKLARSMGIAGDHPERVQAGIIHALESLADQGHVFVPRNELRSKAAVMLDVGEDHVESAIDGLWASERLVVEAEGVFLARLHEAEVRVVNGISKVLKSPASELFGLDGTLRLFEKEQGIKLAESQREAVSCVASRKFVIVTGGPGVGKTTVVRAILSVLDAAKLTVLMAAPTGRAAKRLSETTERPASTIHRLLEVDPRTGRFQRNAENPLETDVLIIDETSMVDLTLAAAVLDALPPAARLVLVGDADQLPSVGPGAVLRDLIESHMVPTVRLQTIFRQARESRIVLNAHRIFRGEAPESASSNDPNADFFVVTCRNPQRAVQLVEELVVRRIPRRFAIPPHHIQVLTPMHKGPAGTQILNAALQATLNSEGLPLEWRGQQLRIGDKVMQTRNDYEAGVFNGDIGRITQVEPRKRRLTVCFDETHFVEYEDAQLDALSLAYAISIHKSQGSEYPAVAIPLQTTHYVMLSRNLLYTAVTRARRLCVLVADPRALGVALGEQRREERWTRLAERLQGAERIPHGS